MQEELHIVLSESPLLKLMAYRKACCRGSTSDTLRSLDASCSPLGKMRNKAGGRFRIDHLLLEAVKHEAKNIEMLRDDVLDDLNDEREIDRIRLRADEYPSIGRVNNRRYSPDE